jgi:hypothetical protein
VRLLKIKDCGCVVISPSLTFRASLDPVWAGLRLIPLAILVPSNVMSWLVDPEWSDLIDCGRLARVGRGLVSPMFKLSLGSFDLWMCISSTELETHLNDRVLGTGQVMVWTSHVDYVHGDLSSRPCLWSLQSFEYIITVDIIVIFFITIVMHFIDHCMFIYSYPPSLVR